MKRTVLFLLLIAFFSFNSFGQDYRTSLGLRAGLPYGVTVKHFFDKYNAVEGILASRWQGFIITGLYENEHQTGEYPGLNWFWGVGAHIGFWGEGENPNLDETEDGSVFGIDGVIGLEYTFDEIPLNLAVDLMPSVNLFGNSGWAGINGAISIRYVF